MFLLPWTFPRNCSRWWITSTDMPCRRLGQGNGWGPISVNPLAWSWNTAEMEGSHEFRNTRSCMLLCSLSPGELVHGWRPQDRVAGHPGDAGHGWQGASRVRLLRGSGPPHLPVSTGWTCSAHFPPLKMLWMFRQRHPLQTGECIWSFLNLLIPHSHPSLHTLLLIPHTPPSLPHTSIIQTLKQMPTAHKRTFVFLVTFMKDLLKHSEVNGLDQKVLGKNTILYAACFLRNVL